MKSIFLCDFDGTITENDFYQIVIDQWIGEAGYEYMEDYKKKKTLDYYFLNHIFSMKPMSKEEYKDLVGKIEIDPYFQSLIFALEKMNMDLKIVSAGCLPYIKDRLAMENIKDIPIITNDSKMEEGNIRIIPDKSSPFFAEPFGIDKGKVVTYYQKDYEKVIFAGDSFPDLGAAKEADLVFATGSLQEILQKEKIPYVPFQNFLEVINYLTSR